MSSLVESPFPQFMDLDGKPLEDGYIFIGQPGLNPLANPLQAYWDAAQTNPAVNIRTKGGYAWNQSSAGRLYTEGNYSILVQNKKGATVYMLPQALDYTNFITGTLNTVQILDDLRLIAPAEDGLQASVAGGDSLGDGETGPLYYWSATSTASDNGSSVIRPTSILSTQPGRWLWINTNAPLVNETISVSQSVNLEFKRKVFLVDTSGGDIEITLPDGDFNGQDTMIVNTGSNLLTVVGSGIPADTEVVTSIKVVWGSTTWYNAVWGEHDITAGDITAGDITAGDITAEVLNTSSAFNPEGALNLYINDSAASFSIASGSTLVIPKGWYMFGPGPRYVAGDVFALQLYVNDASWLNTMEEWHDSPYLRRFVGGFVYADGVNLRFSNDSPSTVTIYCVKYNLA